MLLAAAIGASPLWAQQPGTSVWLDDRTAFTLTGGLDQYVSRDSLSGRLVSMGSDQGTILVNRWVTDLAGLYPALQFEIHSTGGADGLRALLAGKTDVVPLDRPLQPAEDSAFRVAFGYPATQILVALDALGVYVSLHNPIDSISLRQLDAIFSRAPSRGLPPVDTWGDLGLAGPLAKQPIGRYSLSDDHDTFRSVRQFVLQGQEYRFDVRFDRVPLSLVQSVGADDGGITFASVMFATRRTRFVPVLADDGVPYAPTYDNTLSHKYPLLRQHYLVVNKPPGKPLPAPLLELLRFATSRRGQRLVAASGCFPLSADMQRTARSQFQ